MVRELSSGTRPIFSRRAVSGYRALTERTGRATRCRFRMPQVRTTSRSQAITSSLWDTRQSAARTCQWAGSPTFRSRRRFWLRLRQPSPPRRLRAPRQLLNRHPRLVSGRRRRRFRRFWTGDSAPTSPDGSHWSLYALPANPSDYTTSVAILGNRVVVAGLDENAGHPQGLVWTATLPY